MKVTVRLLSHLAAPDADDGEGASLPLLIGGLAIGRTASSCPG